MKVIVQEFAGLDGSLEGVVEEKTAEALNLLLEAPPAPDEPAGDGFAVTAPVVEGAGAVREALFMGASRVVGVFVPVLPGQFDNDQFLPPEMLKVPST